MTKVSKKAQGVEKKVAPNVKSSKRDAVTKKNAIRKKLKSVSKETTPGKTSSRKVAPKKSAPSGASSKKVETKKAASKKSKRRGTEKKSLKVRPLLEMSSADAKAFLLKPESYCGFELPPYFDFAPVLAEAEAMAGGSALVEKFCKQLKASEQVNYTVYSNKDGRFAWRPFQLVHPVVYVSLVSTITESTNWTHIRQKFTEFASNPRVKCVSLPRESLTKRQDRASQILNWWQEIEQASIELALDYSFVLHADVTDCYPSIYTHSLAWALHGKSVAKNDKSKALVGNRIDQLVQHMRHGQTNGIPQGSTLMDFIAEMVLGYADQLLCERLSNELGVSDYQVLRYRDDYRIFVNEPQSGERILKLLSEVLMGLGLKLNTSKTTGALAVVESALKVDKKQWMRCRQSDSNLQKHLLLLHFHGIDFPNSGSLLVALDHFYKRLRRRRSVKNHAQLVSIATDIGYRNPRCFPVCAAIVSKLLSLLPTKSEKLALIKRIQRKLKLLPNSGHLEVWLQRLSYPFDKELEYNEPLCQLVNGRKTSIWNSVWIEDKKLRAKIDKATIVSKLQLLRLKLIVEREEYSVFHPY